MTGKQAMIIPVLALLLYQVEANSPGVEFLRTLSKFKKRKKHSSSVVYILHKR